ncbi:glycosyltransferase family 2 protein [Hoeflea sp. WL0058]|uniref:Glycosyltransferase family 2 protein n=1 Tax=Flavimaribacter sediminis TaxID=2865987 RepID=A0AAE2ZQK6_9HYPH|nr:glycosyltransferase family A protein [Flavimaribacter sediminis]MBW8638922.1 glycosyltransferase family 2 protein [Flavimaribacter sediminis]
MTQYPVTASIVVPAYNCETMIAETLRSLLEQTFADFELIVVDDGSSDGTVDVVNSFDDPRLRLVRQANRGLAGAHNTGVHEARGEFIGFCDADDLWLPEKLEKHVAHLRSNPQVGISFAGSRMIDENGKPLGIDQKPKLRNITAIDVFKRNPIGNGSSAVIRAAALEGFAYRPAGETERDWWFDETFRQSDDIEGWLRFIVTQDWVIEGIPGLLTDYRIHCSGLSSNIERQFESWDRMRKKVIAIAPALLGKQDRVAEAYQLRYLCRRAVSLRDGDVAFDLCVRSMGKSLRPFVEEPVKSLITLGAAVALKLFGDGLLGAAESILLRRKLA